MKLFLKLAFLFLPFLPMALCTCYSSSKKIEAEPLFDSGCSAWTVAEWDEYNGLLHFFERIDILLVVDSSSASLDLSPDFPEIVKNTIMDVRNDWVLIHEGEYDPEGWHPYLDVHFGVITSNVGAGNYTPDAPADGDDGELIFNPDCMPAGQPFASLVRFNREEPEALNSFLEQIDCIFSALPHDGTVSQPLEAARRALLDHRDGANAGFVRNDSELFLMFLAQRDDCSAVDDSLFDPSIVDYGPMSTRCSDNSFMLRPVSDLAASIDSVEHFGWVRVGLITGVPPDSSCGEDIRNSNYQDCLDEPLMQRAGGSCEEIDLRPVCTTDMGCVFPPRRLVEFAGLLENTHHASYLANLCQQTIGESLSFMFSRLDIVIDASPCHGFTLPLEEVSDPETGTVTSCRPRCSIFETMPDDGPCPTPLENYVDSRGNLIFTDDASGSRRRVCVIPARDYLPASGGDCNFWGEYPQDRDLVEWPRPAPGDGWYFYVGGDCDSTLHFTWPFVPANDSQLKISCLWCSCRDGSCPVNHNDDSDGAIGSECSPQFCGDQDPNSSSFHENCGNVSNLAFSSECASGICLGSHDPDYFCTRRCDRLALPSGCPDGYACKTEVALQGDPVDVCTPEL